MMEMREITRLYLCFQSLSESDVSVEDMYKREHLSVLKEAIKKMAESDHGEKHGLKINLNSVFQKSIQILCGYYAESFQDTKLRELKKFQETYNFCLPEIIAGSRYQTEKNSLKKARLP